MQLFNQIIFGWPAIGLFLALAAIAVWRRKTALMVAAFIVALPGAWYLWGTSGWTKWMAFYLLISLGASAYFLYKRNDLIPKLLLLSLVVFYAWLRYAALMDL